jgi:murein DD-endopeptidase MepM/ murein hydrolase activator NlpD
MELLSRESNVSKSDSYPDKIVYSLIWFRILSQNAMNIIFIGKFRGKPAQCQIGYGWQQILSLSLILTIFSIATGVGYWWGDSNAKVDQLSELLDKIAVEKAQIENARLTAKSELDAFAAHIGQVQANVTRLNALGQRLIMMSGLDEGEFDFKNEPAFGGPQEPADGTSIDFNGLMATLNEQLDSREQQLTLLEDVIMQKEIMKDARPTGRPISKGWISSYFGKRTDPFTGKLEMHKGMDFASKLGSDVNAVASGVVTWSGERYGYGNLVEINHGNGYSTRYGHNSELLVNVGDSVEKGQQIARMGSSGRSTGPHVHFEVLLHDVQVDPARFVKSSG